jgi:hypothetical protein
MATLSVLVSDLTKQLIADVAAAIGGDQFQNDGRTILVIKNVNAASRTITAVTTGTLAGLTVQDPTVVVAQNEQVIWGPFPQYPFNDTNGMLQVTYSSEVGVTIRPVRVQ